MRKLIILLATWGGVGFCPLAPGTAGTAAAVPLFLLLSLLPLTVYLPLLLCIALLACWLAGKAELIFQQQDSRDIVVDEVVGFLVTMTSFPPSWSYILAGFVLFRVFDILKPPPIRFLERRVKGGYGVVLDDVLAGIYAHVVLHIFLSFL
ncbi:MAG: phosphatidylglycerophosphatase A [Deltaproteobacteria bacterium]|nr:phosphatidylglycerophosphatase A [Deltaproteobacteria bacterium]